MTALRLAIEAKHAGAVFTYRGGRIVLTNPECLGRIRCLVEANLDDVLACVAEHSPPAGRPSEYVVDHARKIAREGGKIARA